MTICFLFLEFPVKGSLLNVIITVVCFYIYIFIIEILHYFALYTSLPFLTLNHEKVSQCKISDVVTLAVCLYLRSPDRTAPPVCRRRTARSPPGTRREWCPWPTSPPASRSPAAGSPPGRCTPGCRRPGVKKIINKLHLHISWKTWKWRLWMQNFPPLLRRLMRHC